MFMKKLCALVLCITTLFANSVMASASEQTDDNISYLYGNENSKNTIEPFAHEVCGGLPYHKMVSRGWGAVYKADGSVYIDGGCTWQCPNCGLVMVTEGDLYYWGMDVIGKYATLHNQEPTNINGCVIYGADYYGYTSSTSLDGYRFFLGG